MIQKGIIRSKEYQQLKLQFKEQLSIDKNRHKPKVEQPKISAKQTEVKPEGNEQKQLMLQEHQTNIKHEGRH